MLKGYVVGIKERVKLLGFNWTAKVSTADDSITETEQIIASCCCSWLDELLRQRARTEHVLHCVLCGGGGDVLLIPHASDVSVQHLQVLPWKLYPSLADVPLGIGVVWVPVLFLPFLALISTIVPCPSHSPQKCLDRFCYFEECYSEILHMVSFIL